MVLSINRDGWSTCATRRCIRPSWSNGPDADAARPRGDDSVFLKGDRDVPYGKVIEVLDILHRGGIEQRRHGHRETASAGAKPARR